jgi:hypothetical protein
MQDFCRLLPVLIPQNWRDDEPWLYPRERGSLFVSGVQCPSCRRSLGKPTGEVVRADLRHHPLAAKLDPKLFLWPREHAALMADLRVALNDRLGRAPPVGMGTRIGRLCLRVAVAFEVGMQTECRHRGVRFRPLLR